jgi:ribosome-binding factor A
MSRESNGRRGGRTAHRDEDPQAAGHRHARLQQILHEELSSLLRDEVSDPALTDVAVTSVDLSVDYRNARVLFVFEESALSVPPASGPGLSPARMDHEKGEAAMRALGRAAPFLRARLADAVDIKQVPQLRFVFDAAAAEERAVMAVLRDPDAL